MWLRIIGVCAVLTFLLARAVTGAYPDLEFPWVRGLLAAVAIIIGVIGFQAVMLFWIPPIIEISAKGVFRQYGSSTRRRLRREIRAIIVDWTEPARPTVRVEAAKPLTLGVGEKIERTQLTGFLRARFPELVVEERL